MVKNMSLGDNLKNLRKELNYTQTELSEYTGIKVGHISKLENNDSDPKLSTIYKLMNVLQCSADELLMDETYSPLTGVLKSCFKRIDSLEPYDKKILIHLINTYCDAQLYKKASNQAQAELYDTDIESINEQYKWNELRSRDKIDKMVEHEEKSNT
ncbi:Cro/CI family transcriptional regulator [Catenovulum agarivorans DS-2]|uniref:Cro/CI family transcriptional regulator n=1 Tax=Catenovulum agarivorans DS-2 TaxID=1328313 RepID=W7Q815_9ALTE|nr:helix-turn-helix transcriptional regulator [Catenovulum agarivorans]EWH08086.1 Cro/CI family transcriptional regulator [Catenovulum agarivorans DS-2]